MTKHPPEGADDFSGVCRVLRDGTQEERRLSRKERSCITAILQIMSQTGADFTDTFRIIADVKANSDNKEVIDRLVSVCSPLELLEKGVAQGVA